MGTANIYHTHVEWTGNLGQGTRTYDGYDRTWNIAVPGREVIECSNDPLLGGDNKKMNPEELLLSALSACHMLWFLHLASDMGLSVISYRDIPDGEAELEPGGKGRFVSVTLRPQIVLGSAPDVLLADAIHERIGDVCFIARSVNFPILYAARYECRPGE